MREKEAEFIRLISNKEGLTKCFGCGQENPIGLKLRFQWDGETATAEFAPGEFHQGWPGLVHGGIILSILDEAMAYVPYFQGIACFTAKTWTRLKHPISLGESLVITATMIRKTRRLIETKATINLRDGTLAAEGTATMYVLGER